MTYTWYLAWTCCCTGVDRKNKQDLIPIVPKKYEKTRRAYNKSIDMIDTARTAITGQLSERLYNYSSDDLKEKIDLARELYNDPDSATQKLSPKQKLCFDTAASAVGGTTYVLEKKMEVQKAIILKVIDPLWKLKDPENSGHLTKE